MESEKLPGTPVNAADATEEVNQQQAADQQKAAEKHEQGLTKDLPVNPAPDERVPSGQTNDVVTSGQPVTDPAQLKQPDHPDEVDSDRHRQNRLDHVDEGLGQE